MLIKAYTVFEAILKGQEEKRVMSILAPEKDKIEFIYSELLKEATTMKIGITINSSEFLVMQKLIEVIFTNSCLECFA